MNKKYLPSALIMYLNYFIHGVGCSILGQAVIKEALAAAWGVEAMAITAISAALGLGRLIALPFAGPLSDKLGRRISTAIGSASYAVYLIGLASLSAPDKTAAIKSLMYVQSSEVSPTRSLIPVSIRRLPRLSAALRVSLPWESNFSLRSRRCFCRSYSVLL